MIVLLETTDKWFFEIMVLCVFASVGCIVIGWKKGYKERNISKLWNKGLTAIKSKDFELAAELFENIVIDYKKESAEAYDNWGNALYGLARLKQGDEADNLYRQAIEKYEKAVEIKKDYHEAYYGWGLALARLAKLEHGDDADDFYRQAIEKCAKAVEIRKNYHEAYYGWGVALSGLAELKEADEADNLYGQAIEKCAKAVEIKKDCHEAYHDWGFILLSLARNKTGEDREKLLKQAELKLLKAESIRSCSSSYNLACVYALQGNEAKCREWLKKGEEMGTLMTTRQHAEDDDDLKSVRDMDWFKGIRWDVE